MTVKLGGEIRLESRSKWGQLYDFKYVLLYAKHLKNITVSISSNFFSSILKQSIFK
jgi:hypothetical protein